jgi:cytochrome c oxidase accessory protein FixG
MTSEELLQPSTFRDTVSTVTNAGKRHWIYALQPNGKFYSFRKALAVIYVIVFFTLPFIKVNDMPFLMINVVKGKFIIFSKIFWPQDFFIFAIGMITFIIFIVLFTVVFGRLFCGWACPQTIFMEFVFRKIEWWIEGNPTQQKARNKNTSSSDYIVRKVVKHIIFFVLSFAIANTFLAYIIGIDELVKVIEEPMFEHIALLTGLLIFTFLFYSVYAFVREIVCTTICPYGRLQGVMFDKDTMQISYDYKRGEPRGKLSKKNENNFGDCIDCKKCVAVCPTGIDIRNGIQMECIGCTACIDACNSIMEQINLPKGLIRYASENEIVNKTKFVFNTRMKAYTLLLGLLVVFMSVLIASRKSIDTYISRAKNQLYQELPTGKISNL